MAKSHASDNPSFNKPLHKFFGNENPQGKSSDMKMPPANMGAGGRKAMGKFVATAKKEGRKR